MKKLKEKKVNYFKICFFIAILSIYASFFAFNIDESTFYYTKSAYFFIFVLFGVWTYKFQSSFIFSKFIKFIQKHILAFFICTILIYLFFISCKPDFRILADETNLVGISQGMYHYKGCVMPIYQEVKINNSRYPLKFSLDKRPLFYPFCLNLLHIFFGYSYNNAFFLNLISAFGCMFFTYYFITIYHGKFYGIISIILLASYPLFVLCSTSSCFEVFNLLWALITFWSFMKFINKKTAKNAEFLIYTTLLFGQTRYESILTIFIVIYYIWKYLDNSEFYKFSFSFSIWPVFCIPVVWLNRITYNTSYLQSNSINNVFGFQILLQNIWKSIPFFLGKEPSYGIIKVITLLAISYIIIVFIKFIFKKKSNFNNPYITYSSLFFLSHAFFRFYIFSGDLTLSWVYRLGIIFLPIIIFAAISYIKLLVIKFNINKSWIYISAFFLLINVWPIANQREGINNLILFKYFKYTRDLLNSYFPNKEKYILVATYSNFFITVGYNSIDFKNINKHSNLFKDCIINKKYFQYIVFINSYFDDLQTVNKDKSLTTKLEEESIPVLKKYISKNDYISISIYDPLL